MEKQNDKTAKQRFLDIIVIANDFQELGLNPDELANNESAVRELGDAE